MQERRCRHPSGESAVRNFKKKYLIELRKTIIFMGVPRVGTGVWRSYTERSFIMAVTKDQTIMDIITKYPDTAQVFMRYGMHCIFCEAASGETLEEALMVHGYAGKDIDDITAQINDFVEKGGQEGQTAQA